MKAPKWAALAKSYGKDQIQERGLWFRLSQLKNIQSIVKSLSN